MAANNLIMIIIVILMIIAMNHLRTAMCKCTEWVVWERGAGGDIKNLVMAIRIMALMILTSPGVCCNAWQETGKSCRRVSCSFWGWAARCCCSAARMLTWMSRPPPDGHDDHVRDGQGFTWHPFKLRLFKNPPHLRAKFSTTIPSTSTWDEI